MTYPAYSVKPGDKINGVEVLDLARATFGGYYLPLADGTRHEVRTLETEVEVN